MRESIGSKSLPPIPSASEPLSSSFAEREGRLPGRRWTFSGVGCLPEGLGPWLAEQLHGVAADTAAVFVDFGIVDRDDLDAVPFQ